MKRTAGLNRPVAKLSSEARTMAVMKFDQETIKQAIAYFADRQGSDNYNKKNVVLEVVRGHPDLGLEWIEATAISD